MKKRSRINAIVIGALIAMLAWAAAPAFAQAPAPAPEPNAPGKIRIQGQDIEEKGPQIDEDPNALLDMGEEMRKFVQKISRFARKYKRSFQILTSNNLELMVKYEDVDKLKPAPAKTYIRSIDGILLEGLFYGEKIFGQPTRDVRIKQQLGFAKIAQNNGVRILVVDYVKDRKMVDDSYRRNKANKFVSFAAHARDLELNTLPTYPSRPTPSS